MASGVQENQFDSNDFEEIDDMDGSAAHKDRITDTDTNDTVPVLHRITSTNVGQATHDTRYKVANKQKNEQSAIHSKREAQWYDEKEALLEKMKLLECNLKEKDEELTKNNNGHKNKVEMMTTEYATSVSKCKETQCMVENEKQKNVEHSHEIEKIKEEAGENMKKKDDYIEELYKKLKEDKKKYQELVVINDELEAENCNSRSIANDTGLKNTELQEQINKMENKSNENMSEIKNSNAMLKADLEKEKNERAIVDVKKEELEEEIIMIKLEEKKLQSFKEKYESGENNYKMDLQQLVKKIEKLTKEYDVSENKFKELIKENQRLKLENIQAEQIFKMDFSTEKNQLNQSLEALSNENKVLRQRNELLESQSSDVVVVESGRKRVEKRWNDFNEMMARLKDDPSSNQDRPADVTGSKDDCQTTAQTLSPTPNHWYETSRGEEILRKIMQGLGEIFPSTELSRDVKCWDITIEIKEDQNVSLKTRFPPDFPDSPVQLIRGEKKEMMKLEYARSFDDSAFATNVVAILSQKYLSA